LLIQVDDCQKEIEINDSIRKMIEKVVFLSFEQEEFHIPSEINIIFVDNNEIKELNNEHRGIDKPTDVLSFPLADFENGRLDMSEFDKDPETDLLLLGDIFISTEKCLAQAKDYGHSIEREMMFLVCHGVFHLLGYDHQTPQEEMVMFEKQEKVLSKLGLKRG